MSGPRVGGHNGRYEMAHKAAAFHTIARRVVSILDQKEITRTDLARRTGFSSGTIQSLVQGTSIPLMVLVTVAREIGVTVDELVRDEVRA